jgi:nucleoside-diphosphate-sugar epimerase
VNIVLGSLADPGYVDSLVDDGCASLFHFAAILKADADRDIGAAVRFNVEGLVTLLERCRRIGSKPKFFFASSTGVYENGVRVVGEDTRHAPSSSYGAHKAVGELLVNDFTRSGAIDGRGLRYPVIMVRPNRSQTVSDAISAIVREPMRGSDVTCPFDPSLRMPVTSVLNAARATLAIHDLPADRLGSRRIANMPCLSVAIGELVAVMARRRSRDERIGTISWRLDEAAMRVFVGRPEEVDATKGKTLGLPMDRDIDAIIDSFVEEERQAGWDGDGRRTGTPA